MATQGQTRTKGSGASPAQKAALEKARAVRSGLASGASGGGMNIGPSLTQLNKQFENIQQLEKLTQQFWKDAKPYLGVTGGVTQSRTRGGSSAQHAKAGRKGGQATASGGQAATG